MSLFFIPWKIDTKVPSAEKQKKFKKNITRIKKKRNAIIREGEEKSGATLSQ
jgi:hypothetical protein